MAKRMWNLPDGKIGSSKEYFKQWEKFIHKMEKLTDTKCTAFDPDIRLTSMHNNKFGETVQLPLWFVKRVIAGMKKRKRD